MTPEPLGILGYEGGRIVRMSANIGATQLGFIENPMGTHTYRSIAVDELSKVCDAVSPSTPYEEIRSLVVNDNILGKATQSSRGKTLRILREFYALRPEVCIYSALRLFWDCDVRERPILALLCASAREPVLRESASVVLRWPVGSTVPKSSLEEALRAAYPGRYSPDVIQRMTRNLMSSWTQSGHLSGRIVKLRSRAFAGPASTSFAFFLAYLTGIRGNALFDSRWAAMLDASPEEIRRWAREASRQGWIRYGIAGGIIDVSVEDIISRLGIALSD